MPLFSPRTSVIELTPKDFNIKNKTIIHPALKNSKGMIAYMAGWCGHCVALSPKYEEVADTLGNSFPLFYLDCAKYGDFASKNLNVNGFPTIMYIDSNHKPYRPYTGNRDSLSMLEDICKEAQVCNRLKKK